MRFLLVFVAFYFYESKRIYNYTIVFWQNKIWQQVLSYYQTAVLKNYKPDKNQDVSVAPIKADNSNKSSKKRADKNVSLVEIAESVTATEADSRDARIERLEKKFDDLIAVLMAQKLDGK